MQWVCIDRYHTIRNVFGLDEVTSKGIFEKNTLLLFTLVHYIEDNMVLSYWMFRYSYVWYTCIVLHSWLLCWQCATCTCFVNIDALCATIYWAIRTAAATAGMVTINFFAKKGLLIAFFAGCGLFLISMHLEHEKHLAWGPPSLTHRLFDHWIRLGFLPDGKNCSWPQTRFYSTLSAEWLLHECATHFWLCSTWRGLWRLLVVWLS